MKNNGNQRDNGKENELVVNGYSFETQEEYEKALEEKKSIENLMKKVNLEKKELLVALYSGLVTQNKLSTVIGLEYLCRLLRLRSCRQYRQAHSRLKRLLDIDCRICSKSLMSRKKKR